MSSTSRAVVQRTLRGPVTLKGNSLHTGEAVMLTLQPAPPNSGIHFRRRDLPDGPTVAARIENVRMVERATTLGEGSVKVHTVEHVLSALAGMQVDNAVIEMDATEPPIGDGSALPYVELIERAGVEEQDAPRKTFDVREPVTVQTRSGSILTILPDPAFRISCTQAGKAQRYTQYLSLEITPETYRREIAPARTFVHSEDIQPLMDKDLIRGGSLENAIVIQDNAIMSNGPLRFEDEFVRHKILDVVGDLSLLGQPIRGHVVAIKPGHGPNTELALTLMRAQARMRALVPPPVIPSGEGVLDVNDVMNILPHRYPFLLVDRLVGFEGETKCTGVKAVTINEPFFQGHFPGHPVMPGVLQVEAMAQVASCLMMRMSDNAGKIGYFMSADKVRFRKPVFPGDTLFIHVELVKARRNLGKAVCHCVVNQEVVSEGELMFSVLDR